MTEPPKISVLIVDDHQVVREGLRRIIEMDKEINVVGEAQNGQEAIDKALALIPDVILMDLKMPVMDGITATREIKKRLPETNILVLTLYAEDFVKEAIDAGVSGYLLKETESNQITQGIHQVRAGLFPIAPTLTRDLVNGIANHNRNSDSPVLTERQTEVLKLISEGMRSKDIGDTLFLSMSTVKREIRNIFDKLGVNDRPHAVSEAMKRKLI